MSLSSYFEAFSYSVSVVTHHKTHTISHPISDKSPGLSSRNFHSLSTSLRHPISHQSQSHSPQTCTHTHQSPLPRAASFSCPFDGEIRPPAIHRRLGQPKRREDQIILRRGKIIG